MCPNCTAATTNNSLCKTCRREYITDIRRIRTTMHNLKQLAEKQVRIGAREHGTNTGFAPSPINWNAEDLYDRIIAWMQNTLGQTDIRLALIPARKWRTMWTKLLTERNSILNQPNAADNMRQLARLIRQADSMLIPPEQTIIIGTCPYCAACAQTPPDAKTWTCPECGSDYDTSEVRKTAIGKLHHITFTGTPTACSRYMAKRFGIHINPATIRSWLRRGNLTQTQPAGRNTYQFNLGELAEKANTD